MTSKKHYGKQTGRPITHELPTPAGGVRLETFVPWTLVRRGLKKRVITPLDAPQEFLVEATRERETLAAAQDSALIRALGLAYHWQRLLDEERFASLTEIAVAEGIDLAQASKIIRLTQLAPDLVEGIAHGRIKVGVSQLLRGKLFASWRAQRKALNVDIC
jgi:hypothetical protein